MGFNPYRKYRARPTDYVLLALVFGVALGLVAWAVAGLTQKADSWCVRVTPSTAITSKRTSTSPGWLAPQPGFGE